MRFFDWLVVIVMGVVGWLVVSFLLNRSKPNEDATSDEGLPTSTDAGPRAATADAEFTDVPRLPSHQLSLEEMGRAWASILGVSSDASGAQIEAAYHAKLAEYDRIRFDANASASHRESAEQQRARVNQAYEFIRPSRP